jgi:hypothetical protein
MATSRARAKMKRYFKELIHTFRFTFEDISQTSGIDVERLKAINKSEEPTREEGLIMQKITLTMSRKRGEDTGEESE